MAVRDDPARRLAVRLRELRTAGWPGVQVTQAHLATALGVSVPSISSWESGDATPTPQRLAGYARFFATRRSMAGETPHLVEVAALDGDERKLHDELLADLLQRRDAISGSAGAGSLDSVAPRTAPPTDSYWHFADEAPVTVVCGELPKRLHGDESYTRPDSPDFVELSLYADIDALMELHGHVRAANPTAQVTFGLARTVRRDHLTTHLVLLGGVDWNEWTAEALNVLGVPVKQSNREDESEWGYFAASDGQLFEPVLRTVDGKQTLVEDVAHFVRAPNPFNQRRTVTLCNGMYARGVYGAVRALTDARFRDRNAGYIRARFAVGEAFSILSRVQVVAGEVITPDWTKPGTVLHEWPEVGA